MLDNFQIPAMTLMAALLVAFVYLQLRFRGPRAMLWTLGLACAELHSVVLAFGSRLLEIRELNTPFAPAWIEMAGEWALLLSAVLFLAALSPLTFRFGDWQVLFAVPYIAPQLVYALLYYRVSQHPQGLLIWAYVALAGLIVLAALAWCVQKGPMPIWLATAIVAFGAVLSVPLFMRGNVGWPLLILESGNMIMTALLVAFTFRRVSPGVFLSCAGFVAWALPPFFLRTNGGSTLGAVLPVELVEVAKVVVAIGLILLVLEDEVAKNQESERRERRVRLELEAYARQALTARSLEEFDRDSSQYCSMIVEHSRFASAAMLVRGSSGSYALVGYAGMDGATAGALDALAQRLPPDSMVDAGTEDGEPKSPRLAPETSTIDLDLSPWLTPGDDLERLRLTRIGVVPMFGPDKSADGALLLAGLRIARESLRADDLLPLEILAGRLQAARAQAMMLGKLIDSERFAGVGQLANNVAQQLNNPLTVILGYSALLEESTSAGTDRRGAEAIAIEARRMKVLLDRLSRFSKLTTERFNSFSVTDLITDIEQMHRTDFLRHSIEFRLTFEQDLPDIFGNAHQVRQALLHAMQFAIETVQRVGPNLEKSIRIEAGVEDGRVHILIRHSGAGFPHPDRVFDSFSTGFSGSEATGIGLSLCAAIVREHRGTIMALNYQPAGAAILVDLPVS